MPSKHKPTGGAKKGAAKPKQKTIIKSLDPVLPREIRLRERKFKFTDKQKAFSEAMMNDNNKIIFIKGGAGTGKTILAVYSALMLMKKNPDLGLIYVRAVVESAAHSMGYLKGDRDEKLLPYTEVLEEKLQELVVPSDRISLLADESIICIPNNFIRGRSFIDKVIIADEAQNFCEKEILTIMTRIASGTKLILLADVDQSDIRNSGFQRAFDLFNDQESRNNGVVCLEFAPEDCVRSKIVKFVLGKFNL